MKLPSITETINAKERIDYSKYRLTRGQAIRRHCLDCMGFVPSEVVKCPDTKCPLYRYRLGYEIMSDLGDVISENDADAQD